MSKKNNNKKNKKISRKNYKIESLEPRLLMDATVSQWQEELDSIGTIATHVEQSDFNSVSSSNKNNEIEGLLVKVSGSTDYRKATIDDVLKEKLFTNRRLVSPSKILGKVADDIKGIIAKYATSTTILTEQKVLDYFEKEVGKGQSKQISVSDLMSVNVRHPWALPSSVPVNVNVVNEISYSLDISNGKLRVCGVAFDHCVVEGELPSGYHLLDDSSSNSYRADVNEKLGLEASFKDVGVGQHYEFSFELDGLKRNDANLNSSRGISIQFNEELDTTVSPSAGEEAKTGVLGLVGEYVPDLRDVSASFLDPDDTGELSHPQCRFSGDVGTRPSGNVVDDYRFVCQFADSLIVEEHSFLGGLVVEGNYDKPRVCVLQKLHVRFRPWDGI